MLQPTPMPYGEWKSPITSEMVAEGAIRLGQVLLDGDDIYWIESRPSEKGRSVLVNSKDNNITPAPLNLRTKVHEYGGAACAIKQKQIYFSNFKDQGIYRMKKGQEATLFYHNEGMRYADFVLSDAYLFCVREDHSGKEVINSLVAIDLKTKKERVIASGHDFYASPKLHPNGNELAFLSWDHPQMPWDGCELWTAKIKEDGTLGMTKKIAGGTSESIYQPEYAPDGLLYFISDKTGFWNLYRKIDDHIEALYLMEAEFGLPQWIFGRSRYGFIPKDRGYDIACIYTVKGIDFLAILDPDTRAFNTLDLPFISFDDLRVHPNFLVFKGASPIHSTSVIKLDLKTGEYEILKEGFPLPCDKGYISKPELIEYGTENKLTAFAFYYPPTNRDFCGKEGDLPPLIVKSHGGPSGNTTASLSMEVQFWTSRGFALLDVNYGGSTGYGRKYRERLKDTWGITDVDDCANGALFLANKGLADPTRLAIRGGSAGGYTTLAALTFRDVFKAGASYYGVSELESMANDTHKFESRYLDGLIGPYPEKKEIYEERSPLNFLNQLTSPVIFFQGGEDKVVPKDQAEKMVAALKEKDIPVSYLFFEEEGHGFRAGKNIKAALEAEYYFYSKIFHFSPADKLTKIPIDNL